MVGDLKKKYKLSDLCKDMPIEFEKYLEYVKSLPFKKTPNYNYLRSMM